MNPSRGRTARVGVLPLVCFTGCRAFILAAVTDHCFRPFTPESLADDFGARSALARQSVPALYEAIAADSHPAVQAAFSDWKSVFGQACGRNLSEPAPKRAAIGDFYGIERRGLQVAELLFAVHTYLGVLLQMLAADIVAAAGRRPRPSVRLAAADDAGLLREFENLDDGGVFRKMHGRSDPEAGLFAWPAAAWSGPIARPLRAMASQLQGYAPAFDRHVERRSPDLLKCLYERLLPKGVRHELGEYYTPDWLADHVLTELGYDGDPARRILDPACGSGTFLLMAIDRIRGWHQRHHATCGFDDWELSRMILSNVVGLDVNPIAVMAARVNYLMAIGDLLESVESIDIPVYLCDSILTGPDSGVALPRPLTAGPMDFVAGNPPWIVWDNLPAEYRQATKPLWERYGLFTLSAAAARHGGGKKDLSMLMLYRAADAYLSAGGKLGFVVTQTLFQTKGAGDGFRRFRIGDDGPQLGVLRVDDMVGFQPFDGASNWTAVVLLEKGRPTEYPVPYYRWLLRDALPAALPPPEADGWRARFAIERLDAAPIDPARVNSPWAACSPSLRAVSQNLVGPSAYAAHLGACTGGANGVYWLHVIDRNSDGVRVRNLAETSKKNTATVETAIEPDLLYPLLRWSDIARYRATPSCHLLLAQDAATRQGVDFDAMQNRYPKTFAYLSQFHGQLADRAAYRRYQSRGPFYSMYDVGGYTLAPVKVVWRRMDRRINAAVVEPIDDPVLGLRPVVPQETCVLVAVASSDEAHYLCALLNGAVANFVARSHSVRGGKSFGTPGMLDYLGLCQFRPDDARHRRLSALSRQAHAAAAQGESFTDRQREIDELAAEQSGVKPKDLAAMLAVL